ncbi:MAG TPA: RecX family transcriptional regulator [Anaerolineae bacterium]|nr:RecX family transcriptional regulator [Anaerolineae bacterium]
MAKITAIKAQQKNRDRASVYLDGRYAFGLPAIVAAKLAVGQTLTEAEIQALQDEGGIETAYSRTLDFLGYRPRSRAEVTTYLKKRGMDEEQIETIVERLQQAGLLDDAAFAQYWVENRERFKPRGARALRYELRRKGLPDAEIERALETLDASDSAYRSASRKAEQLRHLDRQTFSRKLIEYLARRGFDYEVAQEAANRHWAELAEGE